MPLHAQIKASPWNSGCCGGWTVICQGHCFELLIILKMDDSLIKNKSVVKGLEQKIFKAPTNNIYKKLTTLSREVVRQRNEINYLQRHQQNLSKREKLIQKIDIDQLNLRLKQLKLQVRHKITQAQIQRVTLDKQKSSPNLHTLQDSICQAGKKLLQLITRQKQLQHQIQSKNARLATLNNQIQSFKEKLPFIKPKAPKACSSQGLQGKWQLIESLKEQVNELQKQQQLQDIKLRNLNRKIKKNREALNQLKEIKAEMLTLLSQEQNSPLTKTQIQQQFRQNGCFPYKP